MGVQWMVAMMGAGSLWPYTLLLSTIYLVCTQRQKPTVHKLQKILFFIFIIIIIFFKLNFLLNLFFGCLLPEKSPN
jgi:hypothetical protein